MKARHPIWNILVVLGVLYVIVFGFLYVYMQRSTTPAQVPETVNESEVVAREVDILDAPLIAETEAEGVEPTNTAGIDLSSEEAIRADTAEAAIPEQASVGLGSDGTKPAVAAIDESSSEVETGAALSGLDDSELNDSELEAAEETVAQTDPGEIAAEEPTDVATEADLSETQEATDVDAEVEEVLLGSSAPYRYNLNEMERNTKLETEQGWVTYEGTVESPQAGQRYFLIVQSLLREPPTLFSQGELRLDEAGNFETRAKYATYSEFYETYIISTTDEQAADAFSSEGESAGLPPGFRVVQPVVEVLVD